MTDVLNYSDDTLFKRNMHVLIWKVGIAICPTNNVTTVVQMKKVWFKDGRDHPQGFKTFLDGD